MDAAEYVATQLIQVKNENAFMTFLTTVWAGNHVMITWDNLNKGILQTWGTEDLEEQELDRLIMLVHEFMGNYSERA